MSTPTTNPTPPSPTRTTPGTRNSSGCVSLAWRIACGEDPGAVLESIGKGEHRKRSWDWLDWARLDQQEPEGDWTTWLLLGGRGAGKTRAGAEWVRAQVEAGTRRVALVAQDFEDAREVMIEGESGLRAVCPPWSRPAYEPSRHRLVWPNGAVAHVFSAQDPEGLRGYQHEAAWSDEVAKWPDAEGAWSNLQLGLRLGARPRQVVTTTPRPTPFLKGLMEAGTTAVSRASTYDNAANLAPAFLTEIARVYEGTRLGRQELMGEVVEDHAGALWTWDAIEGARVGAAPPLDRVVVAVDPPASVGADADECGIVVAGVAGEGDARTAYVLADGSCQGLSPAGWGARAAALYAEHGADRLVAEVNQGGAMVEAIVRGADPAVAYRPVHATRGKRVRAEPVAALYERGRVQHVGAFPELEDQMTRWAGLGPSPDRLDALVWALTELMLGAGTPRPTVWTL